MSQPLAYYRGSLLPQSQAAIPLHDAGFVLGATVSDLCRTFRHKPYLLEEHVARFVRSCARARIALRHSEEELHAIGERLVLNNAKHIGEAQELILVLLATPGLLAHYAGQAEEEPSPTLAMHTSTLSHERQRKLFSPGVKLRIPSIRQIPADLIEPGIKHRSRLHWWLASEEVRAREPGCHALLRDARGHLTETSFANLLLVRQGQVLSPPRSTILPGISLGVVEELCRELGIPFTESPLQIEDCADADEAMLCGTAFCLAPVRQIEDLAFSCPGPIFEKLMQAWSDRVGVDIRGQFFEGSGDE